MIAAAIHVAHGLGEAEAMTSVAGAIAVAVAVEVCAGLCASSRTLATRRSRLIGSHFPSKNTRA